MNVPDTATQLRCYALDLDVNTYGQELLNSAADRIDELEAVLRAVVRADLDQSGVFWQEMAGWLDLTESQTQLVTDVLAADGGGS